MIRGKDEIESNPSIERYSSPSIEQRTRRFENCYAVALLAGTERNNRQRRNCAEFDFTVLIYNFFFFVLQTTSDYMPTSNLMSAVFADVIRMH